MLHDLLDHAAHAGFTDTYAPVGSLPKGTYASDSKGVKRQRRVVTFGTNDECIARHERLLNSHDNGIWTVICGMSGTCI